MQRREAEVAIIEGNPNWTGTSGSLNFLSSSPSSIAQYLSQGGVPDLQSSSTSTSTQPPSTSSRVHLPPSSPNIEQPPSTTPTMAANLTLGIEYEFLAAATIDSSGAISPRDPRCVLTTHNLTKQQASEILREYINARDDCARRRTGNYEDILILTSALDYVFKENGLSTTTPEGLHAKVAKGWWSKTDNSLLYSGKISDDWNDIIDRDSKFHYFGIEVVSSILPADTKGFDEAKKVADILRAQLRSSVNRSCGLHVHVGNGSKGFSLDTLKNVIAILWVFDREILRLHPKFRRSLSGSEYCRSICIATLGRYPSSGALMDKLKEFYTAKTAFELNCMLGHRGRYAAYNFDNLCRFVSATDEDKVKRGGYSETIEFRQHEATLHGDRAKYWAMFCVGLVEWAMCTDPEEVKAFLVAEMEMQKSGKDMHFWELCEHLGLHAAADGFKKFILEKESLKNAQRRVKKAEQNFQAVDLALGMEGLWSQENNELRSASNEVFAAKCGYDFEAENYYSKGGTFPDTIIDYSSNTESEYSPEISYYGRPGTKPTDYDAKHPNGERGHGADGIGSRIQWCRRCRPDLPPCDLQSDDASFARRLEGLTVSDRDMAWLNMNPSLQRDWIANARSMMNNPTAGVDAGWGDEFGGSPVIAGSSWSDNNSPRDTSATANTSWADEVTEADDSGNLWTPPRHPRSDPWADESAQIADDGFDSWGYD